MNKNYKLKIRNYARGQIVLAVLLVSAVIMTITMAMTKRTVVQTKINTDEELLKQAFNNAESGLEYYKRTTTPVYLGSDGKEAAKVVVPVSGDYKTKYVGEVSRMNNPEYLWMVNHTLTGDLGSIYSSDKVITVTVENESFTGSLKVDLFYLDSGRQYKVWRTGYNLVKDRVSGYTNITRKTIDIDMQGQPILLAVTPLFGQTKISFSGSDLVDQGENIESTGIQNGVKSVVSVSRRFVVPTFLLDAIVAEGDVRIEKGD